MTLSVPSGSVFNFLFLDLSLTLLDNADMNLYLTYTPIVTTYLDLPLQERAGVGSRVVNTVSFTSHAVFIDSPLYVYLEPALNSPDPDPVQFTSLSVSGGEIDSFQTVCT